MLILEYTSTHGIPEWCAARMSARESKFPYLRMSNSVHHAQACIGSTRGQRDPLQLAEHSGDAAGIVPAVADAPGPRDAAPYVMSAYCNVCGGPIRQRHIIPSVV